jgi:CxxC motif-containing protein (DUF1111 family)
MKYLGQGRASRERFTSLAENARRNLLAFLRSL